MSDLKLPQVLKLLFGFPVIHSFKLFLVTNNEFTPHSHYSLLEEIGMSQLVNLIHIPKASVLKPERNNFNPVYYTEEVLAKGSVSCF